jgi:hypothetical protein
MTPHLCQRTVIWMQSQRSHGTRIRTSANRLAPAKPDLVSRTPKYELSVEWLEARQAIIDAQKRQESPDAASRVLLICASPRTDQTCPSEMSKTFRLARSAREVIDAVPRFEVDFVDLSVMTAEYGRVIYPCKACVSTAMPLCHWPCSCYPNHYLGQFAGLDE